MNFFKRSMISLKRKPARNLIFLMVLFLLGSLVSGAISIQRAVESTEGNLLRQVPPVLTIRYDWDAIAQEWGDSPYIPASLSLEMIREIGNFPQVKWFDFSIHAFVNTQNLYRAWDDSTGIRDYNSTRRWGDVEELEILGTENPDISAVLKGLITVEDGRTFTQEEISLGSRVAIVSEAFAKRNNLTVGSMMEMDHSIWYSFPPRDETLVGSTIYSLEIIGVFSVNSMRQTGEGELGDQDLLGRLENQIFVPNLLAEEILRFTYYQNKQIPGSSFILGVDGGPFIPLEPLFVLHDVRDLRDFS